MASPHWSARVGEVAEVQMEAIAGQDGTEVTVANHPLCVAPGQTAVVARSKNLVFKDHGQAWNISNKHGFFSAFSYQG